MENSLVRQDVKIVATIGPASNREDILKEMMISGMDVARLNFSHGTHEDHRKVIHIIRKLEKELGLICGILADLCGPKIRLGTLLPGEHFIKTGDNFVLTTRPMEGDAKKCFIQCENILHDIRPNEDVLIDDGNIRLKVDSVKIDTDEIVCKIIHGGQIKPKKGVNFPQSKLSLPSLTEKDIADLEFILTQEVDYIALSFVRTPADVMELKRRIQRANKAIPVISKLEKPQAIARIEDIIEVSGGVMVARGDLGVEMNPEDVPNIQKRIIKAANKLNKPVITATQMLESMINNPRPTRAEASDVANAILDGTDAIMLSAESASGTYPVESITMMSKIIRSSFEYYHDQPHQRNKEIHEGKLSIPQAISHAAYTTAKDIRARAIITFTLTGTTALLMSKFRPQAPIIAFTPHIETQRRMCLYRGVEPQEMRLVDHTDEMIFEVEKHLIGNHIAKPGDSIVILSGAPLNRKGVTNLLKLHTIEG